VTKEHAISIDFGKRVAKSLSEESDRACVILVASWVDHLLRMKLAREFSKGNSGARSALFSSNGPFATLSAKLNVAFCADWIHRDVYHDLKVIRKMRNEFAHTIDSHTLQDEPFRSMVARLRVPKRQYYDWGQLRAATTDFGIVLFTGKPPSDTLEDLSVGKFVFRIAASVIIAVLVANLGIPIDLGGASGAFVLELPEHMREIAE
jgi:hypothetical protein